jgi:hypothetical protein
LVICKQTVKLVLDLFVLLRRSLSTTCVPWWCSERDGRANFDLNLIFKI